MKQLAVDFIKNTISYSNIIFTRGENLFLLGNYSLSDSTPEKGSYTYAFDGNYGEYEATITLGEKGIKGSCSCPFPHSGCKHIVAACLDIRHRQKRAKIDDTKKNVAEEYLTPEEIKEIAVEARKERAKKKHLP